MGSSSLACLMHSLGVGQNDGKERRLKGSISRFLQLSKEYHGHCALYFSLNVEGQLLGGFPGGIMSIM